MRRSALALAAALVSLASLGLAQETHRGRAQEATALIALRRGQNLDYAAGVFVTSNTLVTDAPWLQRARQATLLLSPGTPQQQQELGWVVHRERGLSFVQVRGGGHPFVPLVQAHLPTRGQVEVWGYDPRGRRKAPAPRLRSVNMTALRRGSAERPAAVVLQGSLSLSSGGPVLDAAGFLVGFARSPWRLARTPSVEPMWQISSLLSGRLRGYRLEGLRQEGSTWSAELVVPVFDPLRRLSGLRLGLFSRSRPRHADGVRELGEVVRSSPKRELGQLRWDALQSAYRLQLTDLVVQPRGRLWLELTPLGEQGQALPPTLGFVESFSEVQARQRQREHLERLGLVPRQEPAAAPAPATLRGRTERGEGGVYVRLDARPRRVRSERELLALAAPPSGRCFYALQKRRSAVLVIDALTLREVAAIPVPRFPTALWCDETHLAVACDESRLVRVIERESLKPVAVQRLERPGKRPTPHTIAGRTGQGWLTLWRTQRGEVLTRLTPPRQDEVLYRATRYACHALLVGEHLLLGGQHRPSATWIDLARNGARVLPREHPVFALTRSGTFQLLASPFLTADGQDVVLPFERQALGPRAPATTCLVSADLALRRIDFPGAALRELPERGLFVCASSDSPQRAHAPLEIHYRERRSGALARRIVAAQARPGRGAPYQRGSSAFLPEVERFVYLEGGNTLAVLACGPLHGSRRPGFRLRNDPPVRATAGEVLSWRPELTTTPTPGTVFQLARGPQGASVDAKTGAFRWKPSLAALGRWEVEIVARVGQRRVKVVSFVLEVD